ncbi:hypothetical protein ACKVMT_06610 [Halobacteriales archaeon Cl-PHB]
MPTVVEPRPVSRSTALLVALALVSLVVAGALAVEAGSTDDGATEIPNVLVEPRPGDNVLWPFTSAGKTPSQRTLAINVIVHGNEDLLRYYLTDRQGATWNESTEGPMAADLNRSESEPLQLNGSLVGYSSARGATRYTYVRDFALTESVNGTLRRPHEALSFHTHRLEESPGGRWISESYQLHEGDYYGHRYHLRVYESPYETDDWVAIQAHSEHFDWFRLRHTVHGIDDARERLESEFMGSGFVTDVRRKYLGNDGGPNFDGWSTVVELREIFGPRSESVGFLVVGLGTAYRLRRRRDHGASRFAPEPGDASMTPDAALVDWLVDRVGRRRVVRGLQVVGDALLFASLAAIFLFVRAAGIFAERNLPWLSPAAITAVLYVFMVTALPLAAYRFARHNTPVRSFVLAAVGAGTGLWLDYLLLSVEVLPIGVVLHRVGVTVALGFVAAGATTASSQVPRRNRFVVAGGLLWLCLLVGPAVGWL